MIVSLQTSELLRQKRQKSSIRRAKVVQVPLGVKKWVTGGHCNDCMAKIAKITWQKCKKKSDWALALESWEYERACVSFRLDPTCS